MTKINCCICFLVIFVSIAIDQWINRFQEPKIADPIVSILDGKIQGIELKTLSKIPYFAFWNIPYGKPPLGDLRFQSPQPAEPWTGIRDGTTEGNSCIYMNLPDFYPDPGPQDENCLYISVYTPSLNTSAKLPVMFWIYGGGFRSGSGIFKFYGPQSFIEENVILVTFNYRLGPLGFLSTGDDAIPGNAGLKDQNLALKWTKNNIEAFGGDPEKVTIFGESAGGFSVGLHLVSTKSKGLFRAAICHSGCTLSTTLCLDPKSFIYNYTKVLSPSIFREDMTTYEIRNFLLKLPTEQLMSAGLNVEQHLFVPVLEADSDGAFITKPLYQLVESGEVNGEALLIGATSEESINFIQESDLISTARSVDKNITQLLPPQINLKNDSSIIEMAQQIRNIYIDENQRFEDNLGQFLEYSSDNLYVRATYKQAELQSQHNNVYLYKFSFYGTTSKNRGYIVEGAGKVGHFDELSYLFNMTQYLLQTDEDELTRKKMSKLWTNFAKYLNPTPEETHLLDNITWPKVSAGYVQLLDIDEHLNVKLITEADRMVSWTKIWDMYVKRPYITF